MANVCGIHLNIPSSSRIWIWHQHLSWGEIILLAWNCFPDVLRGAPLHNFAWTEPCSITGQLLDYKTKWVMPWVYEASSWNTFHAPILWEEHTLAPDLYLESRGLQGRDDVALLLMLLPAVAVVWPSAVITSPRCHYQLFRPVWSDYTQAECFIHQHSTQTLEVCKQSVLCFIQFRVQQPVPSEATK